MRNEGQRACPRCTKLTKHGLCLSGNQFQPCPISEEDVGELRAFAEKHGRTWKSKLAWWWTSDNRHEAETPAMRRFRNVVGPSRLHLVRLDGAWRPS